MTHTILAAILIASFPGKTLADASTDLVPTDRHIIDSVVYGEVASVARVSPTAVRVTLNVKCTLTGSYDAAAFPVVCVDMSLWRNILPSPEETRQPPNANARAIVRLRSRQYPIYVPWYIPWNDVAYTREGTAQGAAVVEVSGFDYPRVAQIIARLRELGKGSEGKEKRPSALLREKTEKMPGAEAAANAVTKIREAAADLLATLEKPQWLAPDRPPMIEFRRELLRAIEARAASAGKGFEGENAQIAAIRLLGTWRDAEASYLLAHQIEFTTLSLSILRPSRPLDCYPAAQALVEIGSPALKVIFDQRMAEPVTDQELRILAWVIYLIDGRDLGLARVELKVSELSRSFPKTRFENISRLLEIYKTIDFKDQAQWPQPSGNPPKKANQGAK